MKKFASILLSMLMATGAIAAASAETYTGTAQGIGEVSVTLTVEDGKITAAEVVGENETKGIGYEPCADGTYADAIVAAQGVDFDSISGATVTSNAVKDATKKAMAAAGLIEAEDTTVADAECDVVIVGAGGAGMTAALQAVDSGVNSVIIVEKGGSTGGNTSRATGGMNAAKTAYQDKNEWSDATTTAVEKTIATAKEKYGDKVGDLIATVEAQFEAYKANPTGYFDSVELFALDTMVGGKCLNNLDLVMTLTGNSAEAIDWLATKDAHLTNVGSFGGASVKRIHRATTEDGKTTPVGAYLVKVLTADVEAEDKIDLRTNTAATELVMEDGKAVGVKVKNENGEYTIRAKAVILASRRLRRRSGPRGRAQAGTRGLCDHQCAHHHRRRHRHGCGRRRGDRGYGADSDSSVRLHRNHHGADHRGHPRRRRDPGQPGRQALRQRAGNPRQRLCC